MGVLGVEDGITRLLVLTDGVMKGVFAAGVLRDEFVAELALSLLRERLDEEGDGSSIDAMVGSVRMKTPGSFALRLKARSLCSLKDSRSVLGAADEGSGRLEPNWCWAVACSSGALEGLVIGSRVVNEPEWARDALADTCATRGKS